MIKTKKHIFCFLKIADENNILLTDNEYKFIKNKKLDNLILTKKYKYIYKYILYCIMLKYKLKNNEELLDDEENFLSNNKNLLIRTLRMSNIDYKTQKLAELNESIYYIKKNYNIFIPKKNKLINIFNEDDINLSILRLF
jgi:hypothetical protein